MFDSRKMWWNASPMKYSDDEARDDHGRWSGGGGSDSHGGKAEAAVSEAIAASASAGNYGGSRNNDLNGEEKDTFVASAHQALLAKGFKVGKQTASRQPGLVVTTQKYTHSKGHRAAITTATDDYGKSDVSIGIWRKPGKDL